MVNLETRILLSFLYVISIAAPSIAQVVPDSSLGTNNSIVTDGIIKGNNGKIITGGFKSGSNLLQSFKDFNVSPGSGVYFNNPFDVQNILARITGVNPSNIFGTLGVLGNANLFLLNPNGIIFGPNARLDLNGSFLATTADSVQFENGYEFNAISANQPPLIQVNIPIGLNFNINKGTIEVQGSGHNLVSKGSGAIPLISSNGIIPTGLQVKQGKSIALIGSTINLTGGIVTAPSGLIEVASISSGNAGLNLGAAGSISFNFDKVLKRGDISLSNFALLNASGFSSGNISLFGKNITFTDESLSLISNYGITPSGSILVNASNDFTITGDTASTPILPINEIAGGGLRTEAYSSGKGANIEVIANNLTLQGAGRIYTQALTNGEGGDINLRVLNSTKILGNSSFNPSYPFGSLIATSGLGTGSAGNISLSTIDFIISDGGALTSAGFGKSDSGDINLKAKTILITGYNKVSLSPSQISSLSQGSGEGGNIKINTGVASFTNGGSALTSTLATGLAGDLFINASEFVEVSGTIPNSLPSSISASALLVNPTIQKGLGLPPIPSGNSGSITIVTPLLKISNKAAIIVKNDGPGDAGIIKITTNQTVLQGGDILASTQGGNGGIVNLFTRSLILQNGKIIASARGDGKGGDINIDSTLIAGDTTSFISANAVQGLGGRININTQGLIFDPENITATSDRGAQYGGNIDINFSTSNFSAKSELTQNLVFKNSQISCTKPLSTLRNITADALNMPDDRLEAFARANGIPMTVDANGKKTPWVKLQGWIPSGNGDFNTVAVIKTSPTYSKIASGCRAISAKD